MDSKGTPYYLEVIWDKNLHPFPQPPIPKENQTTTGSKPDIYQEKVNDLSPTSEGNLSNSRNKLSKTSESKPGIHHEQVSNLSPTSDGNLSKTSESKTSIHHEEVSDPSPTSNGNLSKTSESKPGAVHAKAEDLSTPFGKKTISNNKLAVNEDECVYDTILDSLHPYPLPSLPDNEVVPSRTSTYDELWTYPEPVWPECRREFRISFNCNPLKLRRKTICCLFVMAVFVAVLIGMTITISILMERINTGKFSVYHKD